MSSFEGKGAFIVNSGKNLIAITVKAEETNLMLSTQIKGEQHAFKDTLLEEGTGM